MGLLIIAFFTMCFAMLAKKLSSTIVTAPMAFIALGVIMSTTGLMPDQQAEAVLLIVAKTALIVLLFLDAAQIDGTKLLKQRVWPVRMLFIGLPLTVGLGTVAAWLFLPLWPIFTLALLAAIMSPTDGALAQPVVSNTTVPDRARSALTVEGGLNDGFALPIILLFTSLAAYSQQQDSTAWIVYSLKQLFLGPLVGAIAGWLGGHILLYAQKHRLTESTFEGIGAIALASTAYLAATEIGGNGFIAAFVTGLLFGHVVKGRCNFIFSFPKGEGQILSWSAFFLLGLALVPEALQHLTLPILALILVSLFIVRPVAIWLSLMGTDATLSTRLFFGWFGPRGLATALFALVIVDKIDIGLSKPILMLAINTVWISALLHGITAAPGAKWYGKIMRASGFIKEEEKKNE